MKNAELNDLIKTVTSWKKELREMESRKIGDAIRQKAMEELSELEKRFLAIAEGRSNLVFTKNLEPGFAALQPELDDLYVIQERLYSLFCAAHASILRERMFSSMTHTCPTTPSS